MSFNKISAIVAAFTFGLAFVACDSDSSSGPQDEPFLISSSSQSVSPASSDVTPMSSDSETRVSSSADPESSSSSVAPQPSSSETSVSSSSVATVSNVDYGTLTDSRDGKNYKTVKIGNLTWMAENLNYDNSATATGSIDSSFCYDGIPANCTKYGRLYQEYAATAVCPEGWRLPTADDWRDLTNAVKEEFGDNNGSLRAVGEWENTIFGDNVTATNASGFSALPAGYRAKTGEYDGQGTKAYFWGEDNMNHYAWILSNQYDLDKESLIRGYFAYSIRCIKN
ncbi:fibrobacter succinogenes major paralogous domain-containing protein [Fibrobacter succinogenes]|uniref:fibrobacter succinogenes major paralogous domain-containing protein n=1 Tax=Fibrobacter succinogenes TaxID=833 RepID=UPI0015642D10|nr:fibrobacter succinogenes major paralogous domain-containing protein [Fibrobacter succinogenes]